MIEVEKKFRPTEQQLQALLKDAEFLGEKDLHDLYYDYPDYRLFKDEVRLRSRNGGFELKIGDDEVDGVAQEIEEEEEIKKYFKTDLPIEQFIKQNCIEIINYSTHRKKYKKGEFNIDIDKLDFGFECIEVEFMVSDPSEVAMAKERIINLVTEYGIEVIDVPAKRKEYFRLKKPEIYKELYS